MSGWSPPSLSSGRIAAIVLAYLLVVLYALLIQGAVLVALVVGILGLFGYLLWRILVAVETVADATHRLADERAAAPNHDADDRGRTE